MKKRFLLTLSLAIVSIFFLSLWWFRSTQAVNPQDKKTKIFVVGRGENVRQVARRLEEEGLIRSRLAFFLLVKGKGAEKNLQAGTFRLSPSMGPEEIIKNLSHGILDIWLTTIEGWRNEEIASLLEEKLGFPGENFLEVAKTGYMFPDTYAIPKEASAQAVAQIMLVNFNQKFDSKLKTAIENKGLSEEEAIILASVIEREALYDEDRAVVAGILLNRLRQGMSLQTDATVQYAVASAKCKVQPFDSAWGKSAKCDWWPKKLSREDLKIESPYNTYINVGLPPAPISNPGLASIEAVAYPTKTDYLYYLSDKEGKMHYAKTLEEHNQNIRKYLAN